MDTIKEQVEDFIEEVLPLTEREVISYELLPAEDLLITDNKVGGVPCIPKGGTSPRISDGYPPLTIAQVNCEQPPPDSFCPKKGLLQLWTRVVDGKFTDEYNQGVCNHNERNDPFSDSNRRVLYYPTLTEATPFEEFQAEYRFYDECMSLRESKGFVMHFTKEREEVSYAFSFLHPILVQKWNEKFGINHVRYLYNLPTQIPDEIDEIFNDWLPDGQGSKLGGYDEETEYGNYYPDDYRSFPLLQIDCNDDLGIDRIDGVGLFPIKEEELAEVDFIEVHYNFQL